MEPQQGYRASVSLLRKPAWWTDSKDSKLLGPVLQLATLSALPLGLLNGKISISHPGSFEGI